MLARLTDAFPLWVGLAALAGWWIPSAVAPLGEPVAVRWMLRPDQDYESARDAWAPFRELAAPDLSTRTDVAALVQTLATVQRPVIVIANNKAEGSAPLTLRELARLLPASARPQ
jgi:hypothetical protein